MSDNTQDFRPMQARYLELEAEVEKLERGKLAWRDRAVAAEAKLAEVENALRDIVLRKATIATLDEARAHARAALASLEETP